MIHLKQFCNHVGSGLPPYDEQAFEMMHNRFLSYSQRILPDPQYSAYSEALLKVVKEINVRHSHETFAPLRICIKFSQRSCISDL